MIEGQEGVTWPQWCALADACEEHGVATLYRSDHYISQSNESGNVAHDAWTTIAALAARFADEYNTPFASPEEFAQIRAKVAATCDRLGRDPTTLRFSLMTGCLIGTTRDDALERARQLYGRVERDADFDTWLEGFSRRGLIGSVDEVAERLREYERAGCDGVMLQHLL